MGLLHSLLGRVGLASAGQARQLMKRVDAATQRVTEMNRAGGEAGEEAARWKAKAGELTGRVSRAEQAAERLPRVDRELRRWKARHERHVAQRAEVRDRMVRAEHAAQLSQEQL